MMWRDWIGWLYVLGIVVLSFSAGYLIDKKYDTNFTCESAYLQMKALEYCLENRPVCESVTIDDFIEYYGQRDWLDANCPMHSGDGYLSQ